MNSLIVLMSNEDYTAYIVYVFASSSKKKPTHLTLTLFQASFILVSPKYWVFVDKTGNPSLHKQWKQVPYQVEDVTPEDIKMHLHRESEEEEEEEKEEKLEGATGGGGGF